MFVLSKGKKFLPFMFVDHGQCAVFMFIYVNSNEILYIIDVENDVCRVERVHMIAKLCE